MHPKEARIGDFVYFLAEDGTESIRIARAQIQCIIFPGTSNEYYDALEVLSEGASRAHTLKPPECFRTAEAARRAKILELHVALDVIRKQLQSLGDHSLTESRWGRRNQS